MTQSPPPWALVKTWLDIIQQKDIPPFVKQKRQTLIDYYFGSIEFADMYVEQHQYCYQKVS
ncbi:hypothetical protein [Colwellia sp. Arc7-D]|uniref:hypothetical protein n=1 Tax=Colwellia sp. Arc7-D TaxID=2161872 RepID=UPI000D3D2E9D|nr:hypothetical protein [Colwellia sp. Arc7-D]AWB58265.1 hypothetical protein DBO93_12255 [Colwellia sp. Arc7-D]